MTLFLLSLVLGLARAEDTPVLGAPDRGAILTKEFLERIPAGRSYYGALVQAAWLREPVQGYLWSESHPEDSRIRLHDSVSRKKSQADWGGTAPPRRHLDLRTWLWLGDQPGVHTGTDGLRLNGERAPITLLDGIPVAHPTPMFSGLPGHLSRP